MSLLDEYIPKSVTISTDNIKERSVNFLMNSKQKLDDRESVARYFVVALLSLFIFGVRMQPLYFTSVTLTPDKISFTNLAGYESFRGIKYAIENFPIPLFNDTLFNYPLEAGNMTGGLIDIFLSGPVFILSFFVPVDQAILITVYLIGPVFAAITGLLLYKFVKETLNADMALVSLLIYALLPGRFLQDTLVGSGRKIPIYTALLLVSLLFMLYIIQYARETLFVREVVTEELTKWGTYTKYTLGLSVIGLIFTLSDPVNVLIYYGLLASITIHYALVGSRVDDEIMEVVPLSLLPSTILPTIGVIVVSTIASSYTIEHVIVSLSVVVLLGVFSVLDRLAERWTPSQSQLTNGVIFIAIAALIIGVSQNSSLIETIKLIVVPPQDLYYYEGVNSLASFEAQQTLLDNFGVMVALAIPGFIIYYFNKLYESYSKEISEETLVVSSLGLIALAAGVSSIQWYGIASIGVSIFAVYMLFYIVTKADLFNLSLSDIQAYHIVVIILVFGAFIPMLMYPVSSTAIAQGQTAEVTEERWTDTAMELNAVADNQIDPYEFPMEQPTEGVVTWGGEGESQITAIGELPTTSYSDESVLFSSEYLLAQSQNEADKVALDYDTDPQYIVVDSSTVSMQQGMQYMIDLHPYRSVREYYQPVFDAQSDQLAFNVYEQDYYESLAVRLYSYHGSQVGPQPVTVSYTSRSIQGQPRSSTFLPINREDPHIQRFESLREAQTYVSEQNGETEDTEAKPGTHQLGGVGLNPPEEVPALTEYRYITSSPQSILDDRVFQANAQRLNQYTSELRYSDLIHEESQTKVFEKVEGAKIRGYGGPPEETVQISVLLKNEQSGSEFSYMQTVQTNEEGSFIAELPYATENVPDEYTVTSVQDYRFVAQSTQFTPTEDGESLESDTTYWHTNASVPEVAVQNGEVIYVQLEEMSPEEFQEEVQGNSQSDQTQDSGN